MAKDKQGVTKKQGIATQISAIPMQMSIYKPIPKFKSGCKKC